MKKISKKSRLIKILTPILIVELMVLLTLPILKSEQINAAPFDEVISKQCQAIFQDPVVKGAIDKVKTKKKITTDLELIAGNCKDLLPAIYEDEQLQFFAFLDQQFKSPNATSSLTNAAIAKYGEYQQTLNQVLDCVQVAETKSTVNTLDQEHANSGTWGGESSSNTTTGVLSKYALCPEITNTYLETAKAQMISEIQKNASQKKAIMLMEKFKAINGKLRGLNGDIGEMYALFKTFDNKVQGFICGRCMKSL